MNLSDAPRYDVGDWLVGHPFVGRLDFGHRTRKDFVASGGLDQFAFEVLRVFNNRVFSHWANGHTDNRFGSWCFHQNIWVETTGFSPSLVWLNLGVDMLVLRR